MKTLFRILGTVAAVAVTGAAIVALDKILNQKDPLHVEEVEFPEEAEQDAAEAEKTAEAYAEAEAKAADDAAEQPTAPAEADAPEAPAEPPLHRSRPRWRTPARKSRCMTPRPRTPTPWRPAPPSPPRTRTASSTPLRSLTPAISATGKSRAARADLS